MNSNRTIMQTVLLVVGAMVLLGGLVCVASGFLGVATTDDASDGGSDLALFAAGGLAMVIGFGIIAFTRASILTRGGGYTRVTVEQGVAPERRTCRACGTRLSPSARFCETCGTAAG